MTLLKCLKIVTPLLFLMALLPVEAWAQDGVIKGMIVDEAGEPIRDVSVECRPQDKSGKIHYASSNEKGEFNTIGLKQGTKYDIRFTHVNYQPNSITGISIKKGENNTLLVKLRTLNKDLEEVVVTSLGITRAKKKLGYAVQEVKGDDMNTVKGGNVLSSLQGRVAGLNMTQVSGGLAGSNRIVLRGESSLNINKNIAMVVVDGVPINNNLGTASTSDLSIDYGSGGAEINPDDIESISIMKGPNAAALYGSRAANGVLIIKTKKASGSNRLGVSVTSNISFDRVLKTPDFQNEYGGGTGVGLKYYSYGDGPDGPNTSNSGHNWGAKFEGQEFVQFGSPVGPDGKRTRIPWRAYPDNVKDFYVTGRTMMNGVSIQKSGEVGNFRVSYNNYNQTGIMPNTELHRHQFNTNSTVHLSSKLSFNANINYISSYSENLPVIGYGGASPTYNFIWTERNATMDWFKDYWIKGQEGIKQNYYFTWGDNPYMTMYEQLNSMKRNRVFGNAYLNYSILPQLSLMLRTGIDYSGENRASQRPIGSVVAVNGLYRRQDINYFERNSDFLLTYTAPKLGNFNITASAGGNNLQINTSSNTVTANGLVIPNVYNLGNASGRPIVDEVNTVKRVNSLYGVADIEYRNMLFLQLTARNDWSSTLPKGNNSYFYSSASLSALMTELFPIRSAVLNYWKTRLSYAQVGNDTDPYQTSAYYEYNTLPGTVGLPSVIPNTALKPEITGSFEVGTELKLFNNRVSLDLTWYSASSRNQILRSPLSTATGYGAKVMNAGKINNKGWEAVLGITPVRSKLVWDVTLTASANRSEVVELADGVESYVMASAQGATIEARVGGRMGDIYGVGLLRNPDGKVVYKNGVPVFTSNTIRLGNYNPDWIGGIRNSFRYKDWLFNFLFDGKFGGKIYSYTHVTGTEAGSLANTLPGREEGLVGDGVVQKGDGSWAPNTERVAAYTYYRGYYKRPNVESSTFDATYVKLREVMIGYRLPSRLLKNKFVQSAQLSLTGRNLLLFSKVPNIDPETSFVSGGTVVPGIENAQIPSTRSIGFDLKITF
ncbi:SusC/RagA family TonB-linked outer membrane protein [Pseudoflavitalea rhizosphaerae]|uniref:SusC/RagA family TonB-linked outer membrane protein n=1 Tax=Pseudoflavitalea rhizosphaerae TaxID=1884793 RepID=UPI000F8E2257|nr:SusC/RagA family TonB-linked outer membrane protein [Pseudoflavitalea rhizosphaerae]